MTLNERLTIRLDDDIRESLTLYIESKNTNASQVTREALAQFLNLDAKRGRYPQAEKSSSE
jgi:predicted transcriptional regulator